ncbi:MAG: hypothetical protein QOJ86_67 [Bradyrhizobium sp.]|jgi:hypothetical protein|nr:hypothetical protein [Bradyrhizobium sp.]
MSSQTFNGRLDPQFNPFDENYLIEILEATAVAWARMNQPDASEIEDRITFRLAGRLANDPHFAELPYDIVAQCWLLGLDGERLGRLDLRFKHRHSQRDYFAFESKRLHVTYPGGRFSTEYPAYAGDDGMMAFINGQYSQGFLAGGMLGYVMDGKMAGAWNGLEQRIEQQRTTLRLIDGSKLVKSTLAKAIASATAGTHLGETEHDLDTHHIRLFHLLLPVNV